MSTIPSKPLQLEHVVVHPEPRRYPVPLLLLYGAWRWQNAQCDFARRGFEMHAISLDSSRNQTSLLVIAADAIERFVRPGTVDL